MQITDKILSIPPYISSSWKNILSLHVEPRPHGHALVVDLVTGTRVEIPNLDPSIIEKVFAYHAKKIVENETPPFFALPNLAGAASVIQHNPDWKDSPPLPSEVIERITEMAQGLLPNDASLIQPPESGCQCPYCQIVRAVCPASATPTLLEEVVSDEDLKFKTWDIKQENDKLYSVTNPLDNKEYYNVFLGNPVCCTCGNNRCEHIQAVLKS